MAENNAIQHVVTVWFHPDACEDRLHRRRKSSVLMKRLVNALVDGATMRRLQSKPSPDFVPRRRKKWAERDGSVTPFDAPSTPPDGAA
jgi:hypothetical protein